MHDIGPMQIIMVLNTFEIGRLDLIEEFSDLLLVKQPDACDQV